MTLSISLEFSKYPFSVPQNEIKCRINCLMALRSFLCLSLICSVTQEATFLSQASLPFGFQIDLTSERQQQNIREPEWREPRTLLLLASCGILGSFFPSWLWSHWMASSSGLCFITSSHCPSRPRGDSGFLLLIMPRFLQWPWLYS